MLTSLNCLTGFVRSIGDIRWAADKKIVLTPLAEQAVIWTDEVLLGTGAGQPDQERAGGVEPGETVTVAFENSDSPCSRSTTPRSCPRPCSSRSFSDHSAPDRDEAEASAATASSCSPRSISTARCGSSRVDPKAPPSSSPCLALPGSPLPCFRLLDPARVIRIHDGKERPETFCRGPSSAGSLSLVTRPKRLDRRPWIREDHRVGPRCDAWAVGSVKRSPRPWRQSITFMTSRFPS